MSAIDTSHAAPLRIAGSDKSITQRLSDLCAMLNWFSAASLAHPLDDRLLRDIAEPGAEMTRAQQMAGEDPLACGGLSAGQFLRMMKRDP